MINQRESLTDLTLRMRTILLCYRSLARYPKLQTMPCAPSNAP